MDLPKGKNMPQLPPKPRGGGAAARQEQFERERGLGGERPCGDAHTDEKSDAPEKTRGRKKKAR